MALFPNGVRVTLPRGVARRNGLLDVFSPSDPSDPHWIVGGVNWEDELCDTVVESFVDVCEPSTGFTKTPQENGINACDSDPFNVKASIKCATGGRSAGDWFEIARQRLIQFGGHEVESVFWTGLSDNGPVNPSLAFGNDTCEIVVTDVTGGGGAVTPVEGISLLEDALAGSLPGNGYIHAPVRVVSYLANMLLIAEEDGGLYSPAGDRYVIGAGYPGTGPANAAPAAGSTWLFATGPIGIWRSAMYLVPDELSQAVDRQLNDVIVQAEQYYTVGFSCALYAVNVDLTCVCA